jgi:hypothetical protein
MREEGNMDLSYEKREGEGQKKYIYKHIMLACNICKKIFI